MISQIVAFQSLKRFLKCLLYISMLNCETLFGPQYWLQGSWFFHYIFKHLFKYWHFWCSGLRHAPYFLFFLIIYLLKRPSPLFYKFKSQFIECFVPSLVKFSQMNLETKSRMFTDRRTDKRVDNGQHAIKKSSLEP